MAKLTDELKNFGLEKNIVGSQCGRRRTDLALFLQVG